MSNGKHSERKQKIKMLKRIGGGGGRKPRLSYPTQPGKLPKTVPGDPDETMIA